MRLISVERLKNGEIIGEDIINNNGSVLLRKSTKFREAYRKKLIEIGIYEVLIDDQLSKGIQPKELISKPIREALKKDIKCEFDKLKNNMAVEYDKLSKVADTLIQELSKEEVFCEMVDLKANHLDTYEHCIGVAIMAILTCKKLELSEEIIHKVTIGAIMHDIGKIIIPREILNKPGELTPEEYEIIKTHPTIGYHMIKDQIEISSIAKVIVLCHHEREDGKGYPLGKKEELHIGAKIVATCDVFHALLCDRVYREGLPINTVLRIVSKQKLNVEVRKSVESILAFYPVGTIVKLNTGDVGIVEKNFAQDLQRPEVRVINIYSKEESLNWKINLQKEENVHIVNKLAAIPKIDY